MKSILIIGGGLGGLVSAIRLARKNFSVRLIEKHSYPRHKVCGEYVSREVEDFLTAEKLIPKDQDLPQINRLLLSSGTGKTSELPLSMGGIGISRYKWEHFLYNKAVAVGVDFIFDEVIAIERKGDFKVETLKKGIFEADLVIGAFGKRSKIDHTLERPFTKRLSPYVGIKYHSKSDHQEDIIALHNFAGGYCGISNVENGITNVCYLCHRDVLRSSGKIETLEEEVLKQNPVLRKKLNHSSMIYDRPLVINEVSFEIKAPVENDILMVGDAAGMITPLCGNGMAMAVHSAKLVTDILISMPDKKTEEICTAYQSAWMRTFDSRLKWGRNIQRYLFGKNWASSLAVNIGNGIPSLAHYLVGKTHGKKVKTLPE